MGFQEEFYARAVAAVESVPAEVATDVYALSFFVWNERDDHRRPVVTIGYNTEAQVRESMGSASGAGEARWNYAFWLQNELDVAAAPREWVEGLGLWYEEPEDWSAGWEDVARLAGGIEAAYDAVCREVVLDMHGRGVIEKVFGRQVPVILQELEYPEAVARRTERVNPAGLADAFARWVREG